MGATPTQGRTRPLVGPLRAPWAITQEGLETVIAVATRDEFFSEVREMALSARAGAPLENAHRVEMQGAVAVIPVMGPLFRHASLLTDVSGATSYDRLRKDLQVAVDDSSVNAILLNIDSPGGEANGCAELADAIYAARASKPVIAYVGGMAASAGYWLASAASQIVASQTAELGSIGVRLAVLDDSKAEEAAGVRTIDFVSSQSPKKILDYDDDEDCALLQARVDALADVFVSAVARNRGVSVAKVKDAYGKGDVLVGVHALGAGLADSLGSFESVLAQLQGESMKSILTALSLPATATEGDGLAATLKLQEDRRQMLAATGKETTAEAIGAVTAWKMQAAECEKLRAELDKQKLEAQQAEFAGIIEAAVKDGKIPPYIENNGLLDAAMSFKQLPNATVALSGFVKALPRLVSSASAPMTPSEPAAVVNTVVITAEEKHIAQKMGIPVEELAKTKARRLAMVGMQSDAEDAA